MTSEMLPHPPATPLFGSLSPVRRRSDDPASISGSCVRQDIPQSAHA